MAEPTRWTIRKAFAALAVAALAAALLLLVLRVGRRRAQAAAPPAAAASAEPQQAAAGPSTAAGEPIGAFPSVGASWETVLSELDGRYLVGLFYDSLEALAAGAPLPDVTQAPPGCLEPVAAPVFVTVYCRDQLPARLKARQPSLAESVKDAARQFFDLRGRSAATEPPKAGRVRIDVVRRADLLRLQDREAFAQQVLGAPAGLAVESDGKGEFFLPADIADFRAGTNLDMLRSVCRAVGGGPDGWRDPDLRVWRLTASAFVNTADGSRDVLAIPRGLTSVGEVTPAKVLRSGRLAAQYLVGVQEEDGTFVPYWDPAADLKGGCDSVPEQAAACGALALLCNLRPREEYLNACYESLSYLMHYTDVDPRNPHMAFTQRQEVCKDVLELEASAHVLEALCYYRRASGLTEPDPWIAALAEFLLFMQREDGLFELQYDGESGTRSTPSKHAGQVALPAKAALALSLAYRELNVARFLAGAQRAIGALERGDQSHVGSYSSSDARWLVAALEAYGECLPADEREAWEGRALVARIAAGRRDAQLGPEKAPAEDLIGGTGSAFPPTAGATADDLVVFASACMMESTPESLAAARRAAGFLMGLQYLEENSYYLPDPEDGRGAFREQPGSNIIRIQTLEAALRGFVKLAHVELQRS